MYSYSPIIVSHKINDNKTIINTQLEHYKQLFIALTLLIIFTLSSPFGRAQSMSDYDSYPMEFDYSVVITPEIMLAMSNDHQLYFKAYSDYDDLNGDGEIDPTYDNTIFYYGYFEHSKCYEYVSGPNDFIAKKFADVANDFTTTETFTTYEMSNSAPRQDLYCNKDGASGTKYWSGNFLNWVSMTRIDIVRKILYGGYRSWDTASLSVLQRSYLPNDAHSFAKYYKHDNLDNLTPYWNADGLTFCNTTKSTTSNSYSQYLTDAPLLRVAKGNYSFWAAGERFQCLYRGKSATTSYYHYNQFSGTKEKYKDPSPGNPDEMPIWVNADYAFGANSPMYAYDGLAHDPITANFESIINAHFASPDLGTAKDEVWNGTLQWTDTTNSAYLADFNVKVRACDNDHTGVLSDPKDMFGSEKCKNYSGTEYKPIGLLQQYGDDDDVLWGLITGSYGKNKSGGTLRKNIASITDEINVDGTFINADPFNGTPAANGSIIATLNSLRIIDWLRYNSSSSAEWYDTNTYNPGGCEWAQSQFTEGTCENWGNPFGEIMLEGYRYFTDVNAASTDFNSPDTISGSALSRLGSVAWNHDATSSLAGQCSRPSYNVMGFNTSSVSYDDDDMGIEDLTEELFPAGGSTTGPTVDALTKLVGDNEGITGTTRFVGDNGSGSVNQCSPKNITDLSLVKGTCPEAARLEGSYKVAGAAYYAKNYDINPAPGRQSVTTYGVALAPNLPELKIEVPNSSGILDTDMYVTILPACHNKNPDLDDPANCALVDMNLPQAADPVANPNPSLTWETDKWVRRGTVYVLWEDSEQGGDFDQDFAALLHYEVTPYHVTVQTKLLGSSTGDPIGFGFVISGVSAIINHNGKMTGFTNPANGFHPTTSLNAYDEVPNSGGSYDPYDWHAATFTPDPNTSSADFLENPLYYAAKYGGYSSIDHNGNFVTTPEDWDTIINTSGQSGTDSIPDNYFQATNPIALDEQMENMVLDIIESTESARNTGIAENSGDAAGVTIQALYQSEKVYTDDVGNDEIIRWVGSLQSYFKDEFGLTREDSDGDGVLENSDPVVRFKLDYVYEPLTGTNEARMRAFRYNFDEYASYIENLAAYFAGVGTEPTEPNHISYEDDVNDLKPVWSAQENLRNLDDYLANRTYTAATKSGRYIFAGLDGDGDGIVETDETVPFTTASFATNSRTDLLDLSSSETDSINNSDDDNLINFIRGREDSKYRSRTLNGETWLLGDIVHSTPQIVGAPAFNYDLEYGDNTYAAYRAKWINRRQVIYTGANDGMLHAFNGGVCSIGNNTVGLNGNTKRVFNVSCAETTTRPLGAELWAYVPFNALPHLKWLSDFNYSHVAYVDGPVQQYDVNIFPDDTDHPNGWGTIIVAQMRMGGGPYSVNNPEASGSQTLRSSYMIFDVTNPDIAPRLIAEISDEDLGYTTVKPEIIKYRTPDANGSFTSPTKNKWYLGFASGPSGSDALNDMVSDQEARLYLLDLSLDSSFKLQNSTLIKKDTGLSSSFVGGINAMDWNRDFTDDVIYFGTVSGTEAAPGGSIQRQLLDMTNSNPFDGNNANMIVLDKPFMSAPLAATDAYYNAWVVAGSGRLLTSEDGATTATGEATYAFKEAVANDGSVTAKTFVISKMANVSDAAISGTDANAIHSRADSNNGVNLGLPGTDDNDLKTRSEVLTIINQSTVDGWYEVYPDGERSNLSPIMSSSTLYYTTYDPSTTCEQGDSYIYARDLSTGLPKFYANSAGGANDADDSSPSSYSDLTWDGETSKMTVDESRITGISGTEIVANPPTEHPLPKPNYSATSKRQAWRELGEK